MEVVAGQESAFAFDVAGAADRGARRAGLSRPPHAPVPQPLKPMPEHNPDQWNGRMGLHLQASEVPKERLAGKAVSLLQFEAAALFLLLRSGALLQTVSRDLEA